MVAFLLLKYGQLAFVFLFNRNLMNKDYDFFQKGIILFCDRLIY